MSQNDDRKPVDLLARPIYGMTQVDRLLGLPGGTARRWIDGYSRGGNVYPPVVRPEHTGDEIVTWGEFVETRLLAGYRNAGVSLLRMRPAIDRLREQFHRLYPLAHSRPFVVGRELVLNVQNDVGLERELQLVVVRNDQIVLTPPAQLFVESADFSEATGVVQRLRPISEVHEVVVDPLRRFGEPVVRSVPTEIIAEQLRAGESVTGIADLYDLSSHLVEAALRYESIRDHPRDRAA